MRENIEVAALGVGARPREPHAVAPTRCSSCFSSRRTPTAPPGRSRTETSGGSASRARLRPSRAFVLMDEPAAGLPEAEVPDFADVVRSVRDEHDAGVLLIDHNMALSWTSATGSRCSTRARRSPKGRRSEIRANLDVAAAYLGESAVHEDGA